VPVIGDACAADNPAEKNSKKEVYHDRFHESARSAKVTVMPEAK
jgi:hypothetical protein